MTRSARHSPSSFPSADRGSRPVGPTCRAAAAHSTRLVSGARTTWSRPRLRSRWRSLQPQCINLRTQARLLGSKRNRCLLRFRHIALLFRQYRNNDCGRASLRDGSAAGMVDYPDLLFSLLRRPRDPPHPRTQLHVSPNNDGESSPAGFHYRRSGTTVRASRWSIRVRCIRH